MGKERLTLKWGTVKGWKLEEDGPALVALKRWAEGGHSLSAMCQHDTPEQKQAICDAIDALDGEIYNDWSGKTMTKEEAKKYVMEYGKDNPQ